MALVSLDSYAGAVATGAVEALPTASGSVVVVVDLDDGTAAPAPVHIGIPRVVVGLTTEPDPLAHEASGACDLVLAPGEAVIDDVIASAIANPLAATALVTLLRHSMQRSVDEGLHAESAVYSMLQAGPEFAGWLATRKRDVSVEHGDAVTLARHGDQLEIVLTRPHVRNALNARMRDQLTQALQLVALDLSIVTAHLCGAGSNFCAGGDLSEFGTFTNPVAAHLLRLAQSPARDLHAVRARVVAHLHGACVGSGIELPAFAERLVAAADTTFELPEVSFGLIPGAGGTVSLPRRIGRHRTARLALGRERLDAKTAIAWGLIDAIENRDG
jgi:enoyl-CoA hydratase/carnithine racemase